VADQNQPLRVQADKKSQRKVEPTPIELAGELASLERLPGGPTLAFAGGSIEGQSGLLGDPRLRGAQRRALASRIGHTQGNVHLQRVVHQLAREEEEPLPSLGQGAEERETYPVVTHPDGPVRRFCGGGLGGILGGGGGLGGILGGGGGLGGIPIPMPTLGGIGGMGGTLGGLGGLGGILGGGGGLGGILGGGGGGLGGMLGGLGGMLGGLGGGGLGGMFGGGGLGGMLGGLGGIMGGGGGLGGVLGGGGGMLGGPLGGGGGGGVAQAGGMMGLQQQMQKQQQMFQMLSNLMKAQHQMSMSAIRNMRM